MTLGISVEEVAEAARVIGKLEPKPGRPFGGDETIYIVPDIYVHKIADEFHVVLNDDGMPRLTVDSCISMSSATSRRLRGLR